MFLPLNALLTPLTLDGVGDGVGDGVVALDGVGDGVGDGVAAAQLA